MDTLQAFVLGLVQGLTEYLPVSSSGHLTIGAALFGIDAEENMAFTIAVHVATVLSTLVVLGSEVRTLVRGSLRFDNGYNAEQRYMVNILISMIPIGIVGLCFKEQVESIFGGGLLVVGCCLLLTAALLAFTHFARPRQREQISPLHAFVIGLAQAVAVLPGLSRSGSTIATGLLLGNRKEQMAKFSFLMVIPPILGEALLDALKIVKAGGAEALGGLSASALVAGFAAAFVSGSLACRLMIGIVRRGKLIYFSLYCVAAAAAAFALHFFGA